MKRTCITLLIAALALLGCDLERAFSKAVALAPVETSFDVVGLDAPVVLPWGWEHGGTAVRGAGRAAHFSWTAGAPRQPSIAIYIALSDAGTAVLRTGPTADACAVFANDAPDNNWFAPDGPKRLTSSLPGVRIFHCALASRAAGKSDIGHHFVIGARSRGDSFDVVTVDFSRFDDDAKDPAKLIDWVFEENRSL